MYVIHVLPLSRGMGSGTLSYRSAAALREGSVVSISLRSAKTRGIVLSSESVLSAKAALKQASFTLKKSEGAKEGALSPAVFAAAQEIALYHAASLGSVLTALVSEVLPETLPVLRSGAAFSEAPIENTYRARLTAYEELIEKMQAAGKAVLLIAPTLGEVLDLAEAFAEHAPLVLTGAMKGAAREALLSKMAHAKGLIITTPSFLFTPIVRLGAIILERASAGGYRGIRRPYIDLRQAARALARAQPDLALGDLPLPLEYRDPALPFSAHPQKPVHLIDARKKSEEESFSAIPKELRERIQETLATGGRVAVLGVRKGYAPGVICRDCGTTVTDEAGRALSFTKEGGKPLLRSADGVSIQSARTLCAHCGSWNLLPLGVGIERIQEELSTLFPDTPRVLVEAESLTSKKALLALRARLTAPGTLFIGTEFMVPFLKDFDLAAVASADSLLALPFWKSRERLLRLGCSLADRAHAVAVATRKPDDLVFTTLAQGTNKAIATFLNDELSLRKKLSYPPFGHLIVLHAEGPKERMDTYAKTIMQSELGFTRLEDRPLPKGHVRLSFVLKKTDWPNADLRKLLHALPPACAVHIDPESLW